ncbi:VOC family protein [Flavihumibacter fluvii]|uniref:VOC family protein n=1 Tax=Flavihumibacter fluvii TaxID=2838157 RepID=UPI001BDE1BD0|nr:VOC family protein [Flavihumibacter fluvii]ULQ52737.1 VOC family protein [Flavihumibacter fluvii]
MTAKENAINWFEIPALDISRAKKFYETIFGITMHQEEMMGMQMAGFPGEQMSGKVSGALVQSPQHKPGTDGVKIYLNANPDLSLPLSRVEPAGGKVLLTKTKIADDIGFMAFFIDSEGNAMALHSTK